MESLSETIWDVLIAGTGLQQSLLALALSRSNKQVLHVDPNEYYGGGEAAFGLQEADSWAAENAAADKDGIFSAAEVTRHDLESLSSSRAYSLALAPQLVHAKSELLKQLVSSRAYRQIEFLAVGSFFIFQPAAGDQQAGLRKIPSTREAVFASSAIPSRAKRSLMKFLKFVLDYESEEHSGQWQPEAEQSLSSFLASNFNLDAELQSYVVALTLTLHENITVRDGLAAISRHLTSMGTFGPGFAAVYPKWGGGSEVAQVACRAGAVGGGVYMLGTGIRRIQPAKDGDDSLVEVDLSNNVTVKARKLVQGSKQISTAARRISRLVAVVSSKLPSLFEIVVEGAPIPAVAVVAFPPGSLTAADEAPSSYPVYVMAHSSDTGECPTTQSVLYLTTIATPQSKALLNNALSSLLTSLADSGEAPRCLYQLYYEQSCGGQELETEDNVLTFPPPPLDLAFNDSILEPVRQSWTTVTGSSPSGDGAEYMTFEDREGVGDDDNVYD